MRTALSLSRRNLVHGAAATLALSQLAPSPAEAGLPRPSGLSWVSGASDYTSPTLASFRSRPLDVRVVFGSYGSWQDIRTAKGFSGPLRSSGSERLVITYYPFPNERNPRSHGSYVWQQGARGEFDAHHKAAAQTFASYGRPLIFRIGHEWNSGHLPWTCLDGAQAGYYKSYFRRISDILRRGVPGSLNDWNSVKGGKTNTGIDDFYPGSGYVDFIGCDVYDFWPALTSDSVWNSDYYATYKGGPKGVGTWLNFAKSQGKKLSVAEWGVIKGSPYSGGDNPVFVANMLKFFRNNAGAIGFESYFNVNTGGWTHRLQDNPKAGAAYRNLT